MGNFTPSPSSKKVNDQKKMQVSSTKISRVFPEFHGMSWTTAERQLEQLRLPLWQHRLGISRHLLAIPWLFSPMGWWRFCIFFGWTMLTFWVSEVTERMPSQLTVISGGIFFQSCWRYKTLPEKRWSKLCCESVLDSINLHQQSWGKHGERESQPRHGGDCRDARNACKKPQW